jgi:methyl-accepting chemotaxis protein
MDSFPSKKRSEDPMSISRKITLFVGLLIFAISIGTGITAVTIATNIVRDTAEKTLITEAELGSKLVEQSISTQLSLLQEFAHGLSGDLSKTVPHNENLRPDIERLGYMDIGFVTPDGIASYALEGTTADLGSRDYIKKALAGKPACSDVIISKVIGKPVVMFAIPVMKDGFVVGALIARENGNTLSNITNTIGFGESGYAYLVNKKGVVISHRDENLVMEQFSPIAEAKKNSDYLQLARVFESMIRGEKGIGEYRMDGHDIMTGFVPVRGMDCMLAATINKEELMSGVYLLRRLFIVGTLLFSAFGIVIALILGRSISKPLRSMIPVLETVAKGDLTKRLHADTKDELGIMTAQFNKSIDGLSSMVLTTKQSSEKLNKMSDQLFLNMTETATSMNQIVANISNVKQHAVDQAASAIETQTTIEEIKNHTENLNTLIESQSSAVSASSSAIEEMTANTKSVADILGKNKLSVEELLHASETGRETVDEVTAILAKIQSDSEGLLEASEIIQNIASQTNLLSMNAAIEAAHAGDTGKGFSVVADEIRKLAENSSVQGKSISDVLGAIKEQIKTVTELSRKSQTHFARILELMLQVRNQESVIKTAMDEQSIGSAQVLDAIQQINDITEQVKDGSTKMLDSSADVLEKMRRLSDMSTEMTNGMDEMAGGVEQINASVQSVNDIARETRDNVAHLSEEVEEFTVL